MAITPLTKPKLNPTKTENGEKKPNGHQTSKSLGRPMNVHLDDILRQATLDVLFHHGYSGLTTARVAQMAGVSTATLYRRWANKQALMLDVTANVIRDFLPPKDTGNFADDIRAMLIDSINVLNGQMGIIFRVLIGEAVHNKELAKILETGRQMSLSERFYNILSQAVTRGDIPPPDNPELLADFIAGPLLMRTLFDRELGPEQVEELLSYILRLFKTVTP